jgi:thiol-disulfide isomerase/thioredoxin
VLLLAGCEEERPVPHQEAYTVPALFFDGTFEEARAEAETSDKLLMVVASAEWCSPCRKMCKTTWPDPALQSWVAENAIAAYVDIDKEKAAATEFSLTPPIPIVVLLKDGEEAGRTIGQRTAEEMLAWLEDTAKNS